MKKHLLLILLPLLMTCAATQPRSPVVTDRILSMEPGDPVHILLMDGTILHGTFIDRGKWDVAIDCQLGERVERRTVKFKAIRKVSKTERGLIYKPAGVWTLIGMACMLVFYSMSVLIGYLQPIS